VRVQKTELPNGTTVQAPEQGPREGYSCEEKEGLRVLFERMARGRGVVPRVKMYLIVCSKIRGMSKNYRGGGGGGVKNKKTTERKRENTPVHSFGKMSGNR